LRAAWAGLGPVCYVVVADVAGPGRLMGWGRFPGGRFVLLVFEGALVGRLEDGGWGGTSEGREAAEFGGVRASDPAAAGV
jgi:hypothetical protein